MIRASGVFGVDQAGLQRSLTGPQSEMVRLLRETSRRTLNTAKIRSPVETGQMRNAHRTEDVKVTGMTAKTAVVVEKDYAAAVHEGSRPRIIRPRNRKALAFTVGGKKVFARQVRHPGSKPRPWLLNAARTVAEPAGFTVTPGN